METVIALAAVALGACGMLMLEQRYGARSWIGAAALAGTALLAAAILLPN